MSKEIWTVIKYKPKDGCEEEFIDGLKRLGQMIEKSKAGEKFQNTFIKIDSGEYLLNNGSKYSSLVDLERGVKALLR